MRREGKRRFCADCKKHVHDLSSMDEVEARALLASSETEGLCVRFLYDENGKVLFADDARLVAPRALVRAKRLATAAAALALPLSLTACMGARRPPEPPPAMMGTPTATPEPAAAAPAAPLAAPAAEPAVTATPDAGPPPPSHD